MLPLMIYMLGMPTHVAVGTSLFQILFMSAGVTFMQADANHTVDLLLVLPLALCSALGAQFGARLSRLLRGEQLVILLATLVLAVTGEMTYSLFSKPHAMLTPVLTSLQCEGTPAPEQFAFAMNRPHSVPPEHAATEAVEAVGSPVDWRSGHQVELRRYQTPALDDSDRRVSHGDFLRSIPRASETVGPGRPC